MGFNIVSCEKMALLAGHLHNIGTLRNDLSLVKAPSTTL